MVREEEKESSYSEEEEDFKMIGRSQFVVRMNTERFKGNELSKKGTSRGEEGGIQVKREEVKKAHMKEKSVLKKDPVKEHKQRDWLEEFLGDVEERRAMI